MPSKPSMRHDRAASAVRPLRARVLFGTLLALLVVVTLGSFVFSGPLGWGAGLIYIAYDTWLLALVSMRTSLYLRGLSRAAAPGPAAARPLLSVLIPARNEALALESCLRALRAQTDPADEVIVVDDGSTDGTIRELQRRYDVHFAGKLGRSRADPALRVWRKPHSGKARSLNEVWPRAAGDVIVSVDADTILEPGALAAVRAAFAGNPRLAAACGVLAPKCRPSLGGRAFEVFQTFEYVRAFLARVAWMQSGALLLVSGAFAAYRKDALRRIGGYDPNSLVEDYELIHRLHRWAAEHGEALDVRVITGARALTDAPNGVLAFLKQRQRWFSGFLQTQFRYRDMVGDPRYGTVGTLMLPIKTADTLQPVYGLVAFVVLVYLLAFGRGLSVFVWWIIGTKLALDLAFHFWSVSLYHRWQNEPVTRSRWLLAALATVCEPATFQILRHLGALIGWIGFLKGTNDWAPQREAPAEILAEAD